MWSMAESYSGQIVQFVISIILARLLTPAEFGLIGMLAIFMGLSGVFIDGGFSSALIQCKDRSNQDLSTVFFINTGMALAVYAILYFTAPWISEFYNQPQLTSIVRIYCLSLIISSLGSTSSVQLTIRLDFKTTTKISLFCGIVSGIIGIAMAYMGYGVWALVAQSLISAVLRIILLFALVRWLPLYGFSKDSFKRLFSFSSKLFLAQIFSSVYENSFSAVIGKQFNSAELGYYNRAVGFNSLASTNITSVLGRVSYPLLSQIQDDDERLKSIYQRYIQMSAFLTFPILMLLCGVAKPLILFLLTDKWAPCIILLQIMSFSFLPDGVILSNLNLIKVKGRSDLVLKLEIIKKSIAFGVLIVAVMMDSILAIVIGRAIYGGIIALYINTYYTKKLMGYGFREQFADFWPYLVTSFIMMGIGLAISYLVPHSLVALLIAIPLCLGFYIFVCSRFRLYAYLEVKRMAQPVLDKIKNVFRKKRK